MTYAEKHYYHYFLIMQDNLNSIWYQKYPNMYSLRNVRQRYLNINTFRENGSSPTNSFSKKEYQLQIHYL